MPRVPQLVLAVLALATVALAGCADPDEQAGGGGTDDGGAAVGTSANPDDPTSNDSRFPPMTTSPPASAPPVPTDISISVDDGEGTVTDYRLTCAPQGGDHPNAAAACSAIAAGTAVFGPPDPNQACTEIYGGPQTARISGTVNGAQVSATFSRANGCEIARWEALAAVFGPAAGPN